MPVINLQTCAAIVIACGALGLSACAGNATVKRTSVVIDSEPRGATVRVTGKTIGVTPVTADIETVFPRHWTSSVETDQEGFAFFRRMETLEISKDGCELFSKRYMEPDLATDTKVALKCDPDYQAPAPVTATVNTPAAAPDNTEQRLKTLDDLRGKGLVTDEEYRDQRQRILNSL